MVNIKIIMLSERIQDKKQMSYDFYIQKVLENAIIQCHETDLCLPEDEEQGETVLRVHEKTLKSDKNVHHLDCDDSCIHMSKLIKLYTLNMCGSLHFTCAQYQ